MEFTSCESYTVGAEWELQLLDLHTLDLSPGIDSVLDAFVGDEHLTPEFIQSCVELSSPVGTCSAGIDQHLRSLTATVLRVCQEHGMGLAGAGTHPFCRRLALITPLPRYKKLESEHGYIGHAQIAFATHIHVGVKSGVEAIREMRYLTPCLPLLIAVTANSPFWRGHYTGYACYRRRLLTAAKSYGIPPYFDSWQEFERFFCMAKHARSVRTIKDIHWDIRPHPDFGTLECRVMDAQATVDDVAFVAGLVRVLVAWIGASPVEQIEATIPRRLSSWIDRENHFRASHWGMEAELIHDESGNTQPVVYYLKKLAKAVHEIANDIEEGYVVARLLNFALEVPGYTRQRLDYEKNEDTRAVVNALRTRLHSGLQ